MLRLLARLYRDENGIILSSELVLIGTILVLGSIVGLSAVSWAVNQELNDVAEAYSARHDAGGYANGYGNDDYGNGYGNNGRGYNGGLQMSKGVPEVAGY